MAGRSAVEEPAALAGPEAVAAQPVLGRDELLALRPDERLEALLAVLRRQIARAAHVPVSRVDPGEPLIRLGLDSLAAAELSQEVEERWGFAPSPAALLAGIDAAGLAHQVLARLGGEPRPAPAMPAPAASGLEAEDLPLSFSLTLGQRALWFLHRLAPESGAYNVVTAARVRPRVDLAALRRGLAALAERHATLRTTFDAPAGEPRQRVHRELPAELSEIDAHRWSDAELDERLEREAYRPFDLAAGPLLRVALFHRSPGEDVLLLAVHHIAADFQSMAVLARELGALYGAETGGPAAALAPLRATYGDHVQRERARIAGPQGEQLWRYWRERLADAPGALDLATDRPRPPVQTYRGGAEALRLSPELSRRAAALASASGATLFMVLAAAFEALLHRYTGQQNLLLGTPTAGRDRADLAGLAGYFVNPVVLRAHLAGDPAFAELLARVRRDALGAFAHEGYPFALLAERLQPERDPGRSPLFQAMLVLQKGRHPEERSLAAFALGEPGGRLELGGLALESLRIAERWSQFDLSLRLGEVEGTLAASLQYNADLFDAATARRLLGHFQNLLAAALADPRRRIGELPLLSPAERRQLLEEWNATAAPRPRGLCLHELFEARADLAPAALAVVCGEERWSYGDLEREANRLAHRLRGLGVGPEVRVGVLLARTPSMVAALLGVLKAGGAYVPLDPAYPRERLAFMLADSGCLVLVTAEREAELAGHFPGPVVRLDRRSAEAPELAEEPAARPAPLTAPGNLAYVIYTSGSTGRPKGVAIEHRSPVELAHWARQVYPPADLAGVLASTSICFDLSVFELFVPLCWGGAVVLVENALALPDLAAEVTLINTVPSAMAELAAGALPPALRTVNLAGEPLQPALVEQVLRHPQVERVWNLYGPTEDTTYSTFASFGREGRGDGRVTIGGPLDNTRVYLLGPGFEPVPVGVPGELYLGGAGSARGYLGRPGSTAERFLPDPFSRQPGGRLYRTGDLARRLPGGEIDLLGRIDGQVKVRGFRVETAEVEAVLGAHPSVREVAVVARPETTGGASLLACVAPAPDAVFDAAELRGYLQGKLPGYMVPARFVALDALPLLPNGKVDRRALARIELATAAGAGAAPRTPAEELLAGMFAEVLGRASMGVEESFFDAGGHSLLAMRLLSRIHEACGVELPVRALFEAPTVAGLAAIVERALGADQAPTLRVAAGEAPLLRVAAGAAVRPPAIERVPRDGALPLSFAQLRLWLLDQLAPGSAAYNIPAAVHLAGRLDAAALDGALSEIVRRHEALRTTFGTAAGEPVQVIAPAVVLVLPRVDLSDLPKEQREPAAWSLAGDEAGRPFDLANGPLVRGALLVLGKTEHVVLLTLHHAVADGWSLGVLASELGTLYDAAAARRASPLSPLPIQYADYAAWQRRWLAGDVLEAQLAYWRERLAGLSPALELPTDRPRPAVQTFAGASRPLVLPTELAAGLQALSRRNGATLFMTLLAAFTALLGRWSGQRDLAAGTPVAGRGRIETEGLIGCFVNTLVLRLDLDGDPGFLELLRRAREATLGAFAHQDLPFERLVEELQPQRDLSRPPLVQVALAPQEEPRWTGLSGLAVNPWPATQAAKFDLTLYVTMGERLSATLNYNVDLFDGATIERLAGRCERLLAGVLAAPERPLSEIPLLGEGERQALLCEWNAAAAGAGLPASVPDLFAAQAKRAPDALAVAAGDRHLTYGELDRRTSRLAQRLRGLGVGPEVRVAVLLARSPEMVAALLAVLKSGGAYLPLDPAYPQERLAFMLADSGAAVLLTDGRLSAMVPDTESRVVRLDEEREELALASPGSPPRNTPRAGADTGNLAYVVYTSGSTGRPKGVEVSHGALANLVSWHLGAFATGPGDRTTQLAGVGFDAAVWELWPCLVAGASIHLPDEAIRTSPPALRDWLVARGITESFVPTPLAESLLELAWPRAVALRTLLTGGDRLHSRPRAGLPFLLVNDYGPTENAVVATSGRVTAAMDRGRAPALGRTLPGVEVYLVDADLQPVPLGAAGELCIGGASLARGYLGRPELIAERFVPHGLGDRPGARLYRTGDLARHRTGGEVEFLGRADAQVKVRGFRIELGEVEATLAAHPRVVEAVVLAQGEGRQVRLVAYVGHGGGPAPQARELRAFLESTLPGYMVPSLFVALGALPRTAHGKIDRAALLAATSAEPQGGDATAAPRTPLEELVAAAWGEVLGRDQVGVDDDFFASGGHSLMATQLVSRLRDLLGVDLTLQSFFEAPTVAGLAEKATAALQGGAALAAPGVVPVPRRSGAPLSFAQQRLWFLDQLEPGSPLYNIAQAAELTGRLDVAMLARSFGEVVRRHESLRATFPEVAGRPSQVIVPHLAPALPVLDLTALPAAVREEEGARQTVEEARRPFDLARGPLLRTTLLRLGDRRHLLLLTLHHIVADGWSMGVLIRELSTLYTAFAAGQPSPLAELPVQYADFADWQARRLEGEVLDLQMAYWRKRLAGLSGLELPTDRPRPAIETFRGTQRTVALPASLAAALKAVSRREGTTLFMTLLAAFKALLLRYTGQTDLPVGSPIANRTRAEVEGLIGFFANTLVLRTDLAGNPGFRALLRRVRETTLGAYTHEELPFEKLVEELQPERDMSRNPLFQVMFVLQNQPWPAFAIGDVALEPFQVDAGIAKFDLTLFWREEAGALAGLLEHNTDLFDATTAHRLHRHYEALLGAVAADPGRTIEELQLLAPEEHHQVLVEWNGAWTEPAAVRCIHHWVEEQVARSPGAPAVIDGDRMLTYAELNARANRLAHGLIRLGVGPEALVGICIERSLEMVVAMLAVLKAGGAGVALDPAYPRERLATIIRDARLPVLLTQTPLLVAFPEHQDIGLCLDRGADLFPGESADNPECGVDPDNPIYAIYTSGSTGQPKGVLITHRAFSNLLAWQLGESGLASGARTVQFATFGFCVSFQEMFSSWCAGGALVLADEMTRRDVEGLGAFLEAQAIERLHLPFAALKHLSEAAAAQARLPSRLREVITAGEQLQVTPAVKSLFEGLPGCTLHNQYGASETHVISALTLAGDPADWPAIPPVGRPIASVRIHLLDGELQPVPVGVAGELYAGGECTPRCYLNDPALTAQKLMPDPFSRTPGARLYRTGDSARYLADGRIVYHGRIDSQVKIRGFRVELGEVETVLRRHPEVRDAAVLAHPGPAGGQQLVAYLVPRGEDAAVEGIRGFLRDKLPEHMVPAVMVPLPALPLNANGKLDREALPVPEPVRPDLAQMYVAPRSAVEALLAQVWAQVLSVDRVGAHDNFFQLGGHSLLATQLMSRVRTTLQTELPLRALFESPTVAELAAAVVAHETKPGKTEKLARLLQTVQSMSPDEVRARLRARNNTGDVV